MIVLPGPASQNLGNQIASMLGVKSNPVEYRVFPDGESYIKITPDLKGQDVIIVQTTVPQTDTRLLQLLMIAKTAKEYQARRVIAVTPYLAYARQDKRFLEGESLSFDLVLSLLDAVGVDDLIVVDLHSEASLKKIEGNHNLKVHTLSAIPVLAQYLKENGYDGAFSLSPDLGAIERARQAQPILNGGFGYFEKTRDRKTGEIEMRVKDLDVKGKNAVVFDDIISSGGTMALAVKSLKEQGAGAVAAACTHPLFMLGAIEKLEDAGSDLILATDTVETNFKSVSVAGLIADYLKNIL